MTTLSQYRKILAKYRKEYKLLKTRRYLLLKARNYYRLAKKTRDKSKRKYYINLANYYYNLYLKHIRKYPIRKRKVAKKEKRPNILIPLSLIVASSIL